MGHETLFPGVALVTGAGGTGIGAAVARAFAAEGCSMIAITDINPKTLEKTTSSIVQDFPGVAVFAMAGDISKEGFADEFVDAAVKELGRIDYAVNCAGILGNNQSSTETSVEDFLKINRTNYFGCWLCSRAQLRVMKQQEPLPGHDPERPPQRGAIVNIASQLGIVGRPNCVAYSGSKAGVIAMTRGDAIDYSEVGIRVNCICPGIIETPMTAGAEELATMLKPSIDIAPMKRMGKPQEVADCALFLCSTKASFVQGASMVVDGGYIIN